MYKQRVISKKDVGKKIEVLDVEKMYYNKMIDQEERLSRRVKDNKDHKKYPELQEIRREIAFFEEYIIEK